MKNSSAPAKKDYEQQEIKFERRRKPAVEKLEWNELFDEMIKMDKKRREEQEK